MKSTTSHRRAVILGAGGFIGINLANALAAKDCEVICFDRFQCHHWQANAKIITGEFTEMPSELLAALDDATVYHLISSCRPSQHTKNAADEVVADVATTLRYLEQTRARNIRWVFVSSGGTVYGPNVPCPTTEGATTNPICSYGLVKLTIEKYFALYKKLHETDFVVARVSNPYGPWLDPLRGQGIIAALIYKALTEQTVEIWGDGENVRDYLYIDDAVRGLIELARYGESGAVYNVSSGEGTAINELIKIVSHTLGTNLNTNYVSERISDVQKSILDSTKLRRLTGWSPKFRLEEGIKATVDWISAQGLITK
jgi:UDP-glucose 4-epimerase